MYFDIFYKVNTNNILIYKNNLFILLDINGVFYILIEFLLLFPQITVYF